MEQVHITTKSKQYPLYLGANSIVQLQAVIEAMTPTVSSILIISDEEVAAHYLHVVKEHLSAEQRVFSFIVPSGEQEKSFENYYAIQTYALGQGLDRHSLIIALGGGVIGDLAGFVAATFMRGIRFIQVPTTLLAHDSAVGGKVAVNHPLGKNMIGAFYQPEAVIYNIAFLRSLPIKEWRSGFAEVIKHSLIWDPQFYEWLYEEIHSFEDLQDDALIYALKTAIHIKAEVVAQDETEQGIRAYLNFGHTLGHAIEAELGYGVITHGDAVAIGMRFAILLSEHVYQKDLNYTRFQKWFHSYGYPKLPQELTAEQLVQAMKKDKKAKAGVIRMVLMKEIGSVELVSVPDEDVLSILKMFQAKEEML
ncbi:3-dehydroquinate synthase [Microbacteriaceae bacterium 4G12]